MEKYEQNKEYKKYFLNRLATTVCFWLSTSTKLFDILKIFSEFTNIEIEIYLEEVISIKKLKKNYEILTSKNKKFYGDKILIVSGNYISSKNSSYLNRQIYKLVKNTNCSFEHNFLENLDKKQYWEKFKNKNIVMYGTGVSSLDVITMLNKRRTKFTLIQEHFYTLLHDH